MIAKVETITTDVLVIGGGLAGVWAAIRAKDKAGHVLWVDKAEPGKCGQSALAAGDYDVLPPGDDIEDIATKWMRGDPLPSKKLIREMLAQSFERIIEMESWGVDFEKDKQGNFDLRTAHAGRKRVLANSYIVQRKLRKVAENKGVKVLGGTYVADLLTSNGEAQGAVGFNIRTGQAFLFQAKSVIMAAASYGVKANNFQGVGFLSGDSLAMAYRAGGELFNMEFLRGNTGHKDYNTVGMARFLGSFGGRFKNAQGEFFMKRYRPQAEIPDSAPYNELWVAMSKEVKEGRGPIYFDLTTIKPAEYDLSRKLLPHLFKVLDAARVDIREQPMPWMPVGYRGFGGLLHDYDFHTTIKGLYVAGDSAGGATLAWAIFTGCKAGEKAGRHALEAPQQAIDKEQAEELLRAVFAPLERQGGLTPDELTLGIQEVIVPYPVLVLKSEESLQKGIKSIVRIIGEDLPQVYASDPHELMKANEARNMGLTSEIFLRASLMRKESRNFHYREDYPTPNDHDWLKWIGVREKDGNMTFNLRPILQ